MNDRTLIDECRALAPRAYAPYSEFHVAAAARTAAGTVHRGVNMENASYGLTMCAEVGALMAATIAGDLANIREIYIAGGTVNANGKLTGKNIVTPCGRCRQLIYEAACLSGRDIAVICVSGDGTRVRRSTIRKLLPYSFGPHTMGKRENNRGARRSSRVYKR
jgi:cytidine deaminase